MLVQSDRFGNFAIDDSLIITFESPIFGFQDIQHYCLYEPEEDNIFVWLHALTHPGVAFPMIEPEVMFNPFDLKVHSADLLRLGATSLKDMHIRRYVIVNMSNDPKQVTANFKAPLLVHGQTHRGVQVILESADYEVETPLFDALSQAIRGGFFEKRQLHFEAVAKKRLIKGLEPTITSGVRKRKISELELN